MCNFFHVKNVAANFQAITLSTSIEKYVTSSDMDSKISLSEIFTSCIGFMYSFLSWCTTYCKFVDVELLITARNSE